MNKKILYSQVNLILQEKLSADIYPYHIRSAIANLYPEIDLLHNHQKNGTLIYRYPLIQYKILNKMITIIGLREGAEIFSKLNFNCLDIFLLNKEYLIVSKEIKFIETEIKIIDKFLKYKFISPWLALNQNNYQKYISSVDKKLLLAKVLIGNILSLAKGLKITLSDNILLEIIYFKERICRLKDNKMIGFDLIFKTNVSLPDYIGLGKSVSRGFGTIVRK